jgi:uncharacterized cupredoxin-like copper-binding protein
MSESDTEGVHNMVWKRSTAVIGSLALAMSMAACGGEETVAVTLQEFSVATDPTSAPAGSVTFEATNDGPDDQHEFVVIKTDLGLTELPTDETGAVDEDGEGIEIVDEIEPFDVGQTETLTVDLETGSYVLICNVFDEEENESHYQEGMRSSFTVE